MEHNVPEWINLEIPIDHIYLSKLVSSLLILLLLWTIRFLTLKIVHHQTANPNSQYSWRKGTLYFLVFLSVLMIGRTWLDGLEPILAFMGLIAVGLTISLKEMVLNLAGMLVILWRNVFVVGDRIQIQDHKGDVVGLSVFFFTLLEIGQWVDGEQSTGRLIKVPNALVLTQPVINYTKSFPFIWDEISVAVRLDSNWKKARYLIESTAVELTRSSAVQAAAYAHQTEQEQIRYRHLDPKVYLKLVQQPAPAAVLTLRYLCEPRQRREMENRLWELILDRITAETDIVLA
jgi:small-conductance mechanosensitive channel